MVNGATISSVSRCRILHTSEGRWFSSSRGHFTRNEHKMGMCSCKMLSCLWLAEFVMSNEPVAMALTICRASWLPAAWSMPQTSVLLESSQENSLYTCGLVHFLVSCHNLSSRLAVMLLCAAVILAHKTLWVWDLMNFSSTFCHEYSQSIWEEELCFSWF